uniref:Uncharacterized protein n=1 Tax=Anguilla anguilla TaxID=7936 RepID=A0A0E9UER3_ANGAN
MSLLKSVSFNSLTLKTIFRTFMVPVNVNSLTVVGLLSVVFRNLIKKNIHILLPPVTALLGALFA